MKKIIVNIHEKPKIYPIVIGESIIETIDSFFDFGKYSKIAIVTGKNVPKRWLEKLKGSMQYSTIDIVTPGGERSKSIDVVIDIWNKFQNMGLDRNSLVINLGGGVICDMGGFAAATYLRGVDFLQIPTTVLAQVDASVGGKVGINFNNIKNYIGLFQQPIGVVVDVDTLSTLDPRVFNQGFAEIIKHGLIADSHFFEFVTSKLPSEFNKSELIQILAKSNEIKAVLVEKDQREQGMRKLINFGHTIGHAIESLSFETDEPLLHGEAVNIGMMAETKISELLGLLDAHVAGIVYKRLSQSGLPVTISAIDATDIFAKLRLDKKAVRGEINWTLLARIGRGVYDKKVDNKIVEEALKSVLK